MGRRLVVGISGSSGAIYGARLVEVLARLDDIETHLVITKGARATLRYETDRHPDDLEELVHRQYDDGDLAAPIASGTFLTDGMIIAPCSIKTLSSVAMSYNDTLIGRAADVALKERRPLVMVVRETPLHLNHLRLMTAATEAGAVILPPVPGFYTRPTTISEVVDHTIMKILDQFRIDAGLVQRWEGIGDE